MFLTEAEILDTPLSLNYTCQYFEKNKKNLEQFFQENQQKKFTILGCGSSYMLAKSTASLFAAPGNQRKCDRRRRLHCGPSVLV